MILDLEKRAALFSYITAQLKISCTFYFLRDLDIGMHYLLSRIQHALLQIQIFEETKFEALFFYELSVKNIMHCYFLGSLDIGGYALSFQNSTHTAI